MLLILILGDISYGDQLHLTTNHKSLSTETYHSDDMALNIHHSLIFKTFLGMRKHWSKYEAKY